MGTYNSAGDGANTAFHVVEWEVYGPPAILTSANAVTVPEGGTANFQVKLNTAPLNPTTVTVSRVSGDTNITVLSGGLLMFNDSNWNTNQTVTLRGRKTRTGPTAQPPFGAARRIQVDKDVTATEQDNDPHQYQRRCGHSAGRQ